MKTQKSICNVALSPLYKRVATADVVFVAAAAAAAVVIAAAVGS